MKTRKGFTLIELLVVISIIALLIGILLPALGAARRTARQMQSNTQIRGIGQAMFTFSQSNGEYLPGLDADGKVVGIPQRPGGGGDINNGSEGAAVGTRHYLMLANDFFTGDYAISPVETKTAWDNEDENCTRTNRSFSMLKISDSVAGNGTTQRPEGNGQRTRVWRGELSTNTPIMSDRAQNGSGSDQTALTTGIYSIHTSEPTSGNDWRGSVLWADNHAGFESTHELDTQYGNGEALEQDNLFTDQANNGSVIGGGTFPPDANAHLVAAGHEHVSYE